MFVVFSRMINLMVLLLVVAAASFVAEWQTPEVPAPRKDRNLVKEWKETLITQRPRIVLLGNSMLGHGINEIHFSIRTGSHTIKIWGGGVTSPWQYLVLKNLIVAKRGRVEMAIIFFRDHYLTEPTFRVDGEYQSWIDEVRSESEPTVDRLSYGSGRDPMAYFINENWILDRKRAELKPATEQWTKHLVGSTLGDQSVEMVDQAIGRVFAEENLNKALLSQAQFRAESRTDDENQLDFHRRVKSSYLPHIIKVAQEANIQLAFVRIKRRPFADAQEAGKTIQSSALKQYIQDLRQYLDKHDVILLDFAEDPLLEPTHFGAGDHLNEDGRLLFTRMVTEALKDRLPEPLPEDRPFEKLYHMEEPMPLSGPFNQDGSSAWVAHLSYPMLPDDGGRDGYRSILVLLEDGKPLGPAHQPHAAIRTQGQGRFLHRKAYLYFSTSDNSDPNTNGRTYSIRLKLPQ